MALTVDESQWPLIKVRFEGTYNDVEFDQYLSRYLSSIRRGPYAALLDATESGVPSLTQQRKQAAWISEHRALIEKHSQGTAFVISSPALRFALSAIFALSRMPGLYTVTASVEEGSAWCSAQLARAGLRPAVAAS